MSEPFSARLEEVIASARPLVDLFDAAGHRLYLVGGVVRDHLLHRTPSEQDLDATTDAHPPVIREILAGHADAVWTQGERFGTIGCTIDGQTWEITTHRAESYEAGSRKPTVAFGDRIDDDLARRDFTVNAMAIDLHDRVLIDPYGGRDDLGVGVLRTPLDPEVSFSEDPLRMLRAARFHAGYALEPVPELVGAIATMVDRMAIVSTERIRDELQKLLLLEDPGPGLRLLHTTGLADAVLPMVPADHLGLAAARIREMPEDPAMRWAALLLDTGIGRSHLVELRFPGALVADVLWLLAEHGLAVDDRRGSVEPSAVRRAAASTPSGRRLEDLLLFGAGLVRAGDDGGIRAGGTRLEDVRSTLAALRRDEPDLDAPTAVLGGREVGELLGLEEGPEIGEALDWLGDLRFREGPLDPADARRRLVAWWPRRSNG